MAEALNGSFGLAHTVWDGLIAPFAEFAFMRRALVATLALSMSAAPLGVFLTLRRMSLLGDALSHAILPGVAIGFMMFGLSLTAMAVGGVLAGLLVAAIAGLVSQSTALKEDASLAAIYLVALALGVTLIAGHGTQLDLLHILFGSALGVDSPGLYLVAGVASASVLMLAAGYRGLVLESFDPVFLSAAGQHSGSSARQAAQKRNWRKRDLHGRNWHGRPWRRWIWQQAFLMLVVVNLVAGFQTLGTLMAVGLMMVPAVSARLWHDTLPAQLVNASAQAMLASVTGLLLSYHFDTPSGPTIIGSAGALYFMSLLFAPGGWVVRYIGGVHRTA